MPGRNLLLSVIAVGALFTIVFLHALAVPALSHQGAATVRGPLTSLIWWITGVQVIMLASVVGVWRR